MYKLLTFYLKSVFLPPMWNITYRSSISLHKSWNLKHYKTFWTKLLQKCTDTSESPQTWGIWGPAGAGHFLWGMPVRHVVVFGSCCLGRLSRTAWIGRVFGAQYVTSLLVLFLYHVHCHVSFTSEELNLAILKWFSWL